MKSLEPEALLNLPSRKMKDICLSIYCVTSMSLEAWDEQDEDRWQVEMCEDQWAAGAGVEDVSKA